MLLSDAILLGSMLRPQCFYKPFNGVGSCAFGAAEEAIGINIASPAYAGTSTIPEKWEWTQGSGMGCPECGETPFRIASIISEHLNDGHRWTRERIAAWVATVEPKEPVADPQPQHAELVEA